MSELVELIFYWVERSFPFHKNVIFSTSCVLRTPHYRLCLTCLHCIRACSEMNGPMVDDSMLEASNIHQSCTKSTSQNHGKNIQTWCRLYRRRTPGSSWSCSCHVIGRARSASSDVTAGSDRLTSVSECDWHCKPIKFTKNNKPMFGGRLEHVFSCGIGRRVKCKQILWESSSCQVHVNSNSTSIICSNSKDHLCKRHWKQYRVLLCRALLIKMFLLSKLSQYTSKRCCMNVRSSSSLWLAMCHCATRYGMYPGNQFG